MLQVLRRLSRLNSCSNRENIYLVQNVLRGYERAFSANKSASETTQSPDDNSLVRQLQARIKATGPITIADYMREVLTNPVAGYYMHNDVFGEKGDFITSPEISQIFGEMIAIWFLNEWRKIGSPKPLQLVEFGPGRGTLIQDILRVFDKLGLGARDGLSLHLIEVSPHLRDMQACLLGVQSEADRLQANQSEPGRSQADQSDSVRPKTDQPETLRAETDQSETIRPKTDLSETLRAETDQSETVQAQTDQSQAFRTKSGVPVAWHGRIEDVPRAFSLFLAHEFFDALPIHKLSRTASGWREVLVDVDGGSGFRYVQARGATPASLAYVAADEARQHVEVGVQAAVIAGRLAERLEQDGGVALLADYGHDGTGTDTFRAFRRHRLHDPLSSPGSADLTADVDFSALRRALSPALVVGPASQAAFLRQMGADERLARLLAASPANQRQALRSGLRMLLDPVGMGGRFHFMAAFPAVLTQHLTRFPPAGFSGFKLS